VILNVTITRDRKPNNLATLMALGPGIFYPLTNLLCKFPSADYSIYHHMPSRDAEYHMFFRDIIPLPPRHLPRTTLHTPNNLPLRLPLLTHLSKRINAPQITYDILRLAEIHLLQQISHLQLHIFY